MKKLTFERVCKELQKEDSFKERSEDIRVLSGAALLLTGIGGTAEEIGVLVNALAIKDEIINIGQRVLGAIVGQRTNIYDRRIALMKWAYGVIYYTAFFDVLDEKLPDRIRKGIALSVKEKEYIFMEAKSGKKNADHSMGMEEIHFPNIVFRYQDIEENLTELYRRMSNGVSSFVEKLSFGADDIVEVFQFHDVIETMPEKALERFRSQYIYLASHFNEFYIYTQLEHEKQKERHVDDLYQGVVNTIQSAGNEINVGLEGLEKIILNLPEKIEEEKVRSIVASLIENYKGEIEKPIIDANSDDEKLQYPSVREAFIPQEYKILQYSGEERLGDQNTWDHRETCKDMNAFWAKYCMSLDSYDSLMLILGEPGGGKSLLTKILCARMICENNVFIRIPLREVSVDKEIEEIVCEQLQKDGDASEPIPTFKWFAQNFQYNPITIIFDGYDEVLQATGGVYRSLLNKIRKFQDSCADKHRPVRVIVTSRETLIDKAEIPRGTIVMRLLEFDRGQRDEWIRIWNENNQEVFKQEKISPFLLPENNQSIEELSRQPLLLLMLAIYDANIEDGVNELGKGETPNRTELYDELIKRFIKRELKKGVRGSETPYEDLSEEEQYSRSDQEMEKLGVAALGMFIRGKLSLKIREAEKDLAYMEIEAPPYRENGRMLSKAEILFDSFFFIHDSQSGSEEQGDKESAFEFLHKTFYEFLVADLILKYLIREMDELNDLRNLKKKNSHSAYQRALENPDNLSKQYYTALMYIPLCIEPEIIQMLGEWKEHLIERYFAGERADFDCTVEELLKNQMAALSGAVFMPSVWQDNQYEALGRKSYLQYCAVYFMNLAILNMLTKQEAESRFGVEEWKYIAQLWKMNISQDILLKFTTLFDVEKREDLVCISKKKVTSNIEEKREIEIQADMANLLQEDIPCQLFRLHSDTVSYGEKQVYQRRLADCGLNLAFEQLIGELEARNLNNPYSGLSFGRNLREGVELLHRGDIDANLLLRWMRCFDLYGGFWNYRHKTSHISELAMIVMKRYARYPRIVLEMLRLFRKELIRYDRRWIENTYPIMSKGVFYPALGSEYLQSCGYSEFDASEIRRMGSDLMENFERIYEEDPDNAIKLLEQLILFSGEKEIDRFICRVPDWWRRMRHHSVKADAQLLRLAMLYHRSNSENWLYDFEEIWEDKREMTRSKPEILLELYDIFQTKAANDSVLEKIADIIMRNYSRAFLYHPYKAVRLLEELGKHGGHSKIRAATDYSFDNWFFLLNTSLAAAMELIINFGECAKDIAFFVKGCCEYILLEKEKVEERRICDMMEVLNREERSRLGDYFAGRFRYILWKYPQWARKLSLLYKDTEWREAYLRILGEVQGQRNDMRYLDELRQILNG